MIYDYTVEQPTTRQRRYKRAQIKKKLKLKKKLGFDVRDAVSDKTLGLGDNSDDR